MSWINTNWWIITICINFFSGLLCHAMGTLLITHRRLLNVNFNLSLCFTSTSLEISNWDCQSFGGVISDLLGTLIAESLTNKTNENHKQ